MLDSWFWNLLPLGLIKFFARSFGTPIDVRLGPDSIGPFPSRGLGGVIVREKPPQLTGSSGPR